MRVRNTGLLVMILVVLALAAVPGLLFSSFQNQRAASADRINTAWTPPSSVESRLTSSATGAVRTARATPTLSASSLATARSAQIAESLTSLASASAAQSTATLTAHPPSEQGALVPVRLTPTSSTAAVVAAASTIEAPTAAPTATTPLSTATPAATTTPAATAVPTSRAPTRTPTPAPTLTPVATATAAPLGPVPPLLIAPAGGSRLNGIVTFLWQPQTPLARGAAYEAVFWNASESPANARPLAPITASSAATANLDALHAAGQLTDVDFYWTVLVVQVDPYLWLIQPTADSARLLHYATP